MKWDLSMDYSALETFKDIALDLCEPIDENLPLDIQYELNESKVIYLQRLHQECFRHVNSNAFQEDQTFSAADLALIKEATIRTQEQLRKIIFKSMEKSIDLSGKKAS